MSCGYRRYYTSPPLMDQKDAASGPTPRHGQGVLDYPPISELDLNSDIQGGGTFSSVVRRHSRNLGHKIPEPALIVCTFVHTLVHRGLRMG